VSSTIVANCQIHCARFEIGARRTWCQWSQARTSTRRSRDCNLSDTYIIITSIRTLDLALDPSVQPPDSLEVSALLRKRLLRNTQVRANSETVLCVGKQGSLISLVAIKENLLNSSPVLRRVTLVQIAERNADRRSNSIPLLGLGIGRMGGETRVDAFAFGEVAGDVLAAEAVADGADFGGIVGGADGVEGGVDNGFDIGHGVAGLPFGEAVV
jgi:hypothetical protein